MLLVGQLIEEWKNFSMARIVLQTKVRYYKFLQSETGLWKTWGKIAYGKEELSLTWSEKRCMAMDQFMEKEEIDSGATQSDRF